MVFSEQISTPSRRVFVVCLNATPRAQRLVRDGATHLKRSNTSRRRQESWCVYGRATNARITIPSYCVSQLSRLWALFLGLLVESCARLTFVRDDGVERFRYPYSYSYRTPCCGSSPMHSRYEYEYVATRHVSYFSSRVQVLSRPAQVESSPFQTPPPGAGAAAAALAALAVRCRSVRALE